MKTKLLATLMLGIGASTGAQAALIDRGGGLLYDNVLNLTWLQDANYALTSGYDADGKMDWNSATTWAANLVYGGYSDWRLASNTPVNGTSFNYNYAVDGSTDIGFNITSPNSELAYMYHVNLGLKGYFSPANVYQPDFGIFGNGTYNGVDQSSFGQNNVGLVTNLQALVYWSGSVYAPSPDRAWFFDSINGVQTNYPKNDQQHAWAVRPGDVAAVPVPGAVWLFGSALIALLGLKQRGNIG